MIFFSLRVMNIIKVDFQFDIPDALYVSVLPFVRWTEIQGHTLVADIPLSP